MAWTKCGGKQEPCLSRANGSLQGGLDFILRMGWRILRGRLAKLIYIFRSSWLPRGGYIEGGQGWK